MSEEKRNKTRVIVIGGGFAGLQCARNLNNVEGIEVLLLDKLSYHQFQPLFYQVATAGLEASNISFPLRKVFHNSKNVRIRITEVLQVLTDKKEVITDIGTFYYDKLILATGTTTNFFGNEKLQALCLPMKTTLEAMIMMNVVINNFEDALDVKNDIERSITMSVAVVGGGPTGVELAGALAEMRSKILPKDYPDLNLGLMHIYLIDRGEQPLSKMSDKSSRDAKKYLESMGVILKMKTGVRSFDGQEVVMDNGENLKLNTVIWAAGVIGTFPPGLNPDCIVHANRLSVNRFNEVGGVKDIYAIGDIAYMTTPGYPEAHPQLASVAGDQGEHLAKNLIREHKGEPLKEFEFVDKGTMATIGKRKAVVDLVKPKLYINGRLAWLIWMFLHLMLILGVKNKIQIFINWAYKYFTSDQSLRLVQRKNGLSYTLEQMIKSENILTNPVSND